MKKLLINGCSFVAGDAIVWDEFAQLNDLKYQDWVYASDKRIEDLKQYYRFEWRRKRNLPALLANKLNSELFDISEDGNSNDSIAFTTIQALLKIPSQERKNYHVVVAWTSPMRFMKYSTETNCYLNLISNHLNADSLYLVRELREYLKSIVEYTYDHDLYYNYVRNIIMLENFLKINECTYTMYRNLGCVNEFSKCTIWPIHSQISLLNSADDCAAYTDDSCWFKFVDSNIPGLNGHSLTSEYLDRKKWNWINDTNAHPNINVINDFSLRLANFIRNQNVGF